MWSLTRLIIRSGLGSFSVGVGEVISTTPPCAAGLAVGGTQAAARHHRGHTRKPSPQTSSRKSVKDPAAFTATDQWPTIRSLGRRHIRLAGHQNGPRSWAVIGTRAAGGLLTEKSRGGVPDGWIAGARQSFTIRAAPEYVTGIATALLPRNRVVVHTWRIFDAHHGSLHI